METINPNHILKAMAKLDEAKAELEVLLANSTAPKPHPYPKPAVLIRSKGSRRRRV